MNHVINPSSNDQAKDKELFDPKDCPPLIKQIFRNIFATEWLVSLVFLAAVGAWWITANSTYESDVFQSISFLYTFTKTVVVINNVFIYVALIVMIFLPGQMKRMICNWLNRPDKLNIKKNSEEGKKIHAILDGPNRHFRLIFLSTLVGMIVLGVGWHALKNFTELSSPINPFHAAWKNGIETREFTDGPMPSIIHTFIVMLGGGIFFLYAIDMWYLIYALRVLSNTIPDDIVKRKINPYHADRMGGLKPYSTIAIRLATYNTVPYIMIIPFITQYLTTDSLISQLVSVAMIVSIFIGIGLIIWIMMSPLNHNLKQFKEKFDRKVYEAINNPRFESSLDMVIMNGTSPSPEESIFFSATLSLWNVTSNMKTSVFDLNELKWTFLKVTAPITGFLAKIVL